MTKITKAQFLAEQKEETFFQDFAELFAHFNVKDFMASLSSYLQLNYTPDELRAAPTTPRAYRKMLALATITLINRDAIVPLTTFNKLAEEDLDKLRRETGIDVPVPTPPAPTADELLEAEVRRDWKALGMDGIRKKRAASRQYGLTLDRLANNNTLESSVTSLRQAQ